MSESDKILNDIRLYLKIKAIAELKQTALNTLNTYEKSLVYSNLNGTNSQTKLEQITGVPQRTISDWLTLFVELHLAVTPDNYYENYRALFSLSDFSINLNTLKKRDVKKTQKTNEKKELNTVSSNEPKQ